MPSPQKDPGPPANEIVGANISTLSWNELLDLLIGAALIGVRASKDQYPLVWDNTNQKYDLAPGFTTLAAGTSITPTYQRKKLWLAPGTNISFGVADSAPADATKVTINGIFTVT